MDLMRESGTTSLRRLSARDCVFSSLCSRCRRTSCSDVRALIPASRTSVLSTLFSCSRSRTRGEERLDRAVSPSRELVTSPFAPKGGAADSCGPTAFPIKGSADCAASRLSTATTALTFTTSPSKYRISERTPATGAGISASTLSVEISKSGSSFSTCSPTFFSHLVIVPSVIDSPICGINTSVLIQFLSQQKMGRQANTPIFASARVSRGVVVLLQDRWNLRTMKQAYQNRPQRHSA